METVKVALPVENDAISQHFGQCTQFKVYTITDRAVVGSEIVVTGEMGHDELGLWFLQNGIQAVICGGIGAGAQGALAAAGIIVFPGVEGACDAAIEKLLTGELIAQYAATCGCHGGCHGHDGGCHSGGCHGSSGGCSCHCH